MAKKAAANTDELVKQALVKLVAEGPFRMTGRGDHPPLFASAAGANRDVIARLKDQTRPLVAENGAGRAAMLVLTPAGLELAAGAMPHEKVGAAARGIAETLPLGEQVAFLQEFLPKFPTAAPDLEPLLAEAVRRHTAETQARIEAERKRAERLEASRAALEKCLAHLDTLKSVRIGELTAMLLAAGGSVPEQSTAVAEVPTREATRASAATTPPEPVTEEDRDFRRDAAERLVSSWRDAVNMKKDEARRFLETALDNISGLRRIGEEGEEARFDGSLHQSMPGVFTDHPVKVTRSGWALELDGDRQYVIEKAQVAK